MTNPIAVRTLIARFVTETCQAARKSEKGRQKEIEDITRKEMEIAMSSLAISAVCPPLPPPPPPPPPPLPPKPIKYSEREQSLCASNGINGSKGPLKPIRQSSTSSTACSIASKSKEGERRREEDPEQSKNPFLDSDDAEEEHRRKGTVEVVRGNSSDKDVRSKNEKGEKKMQRCSAGNPFGDDESY